jgi:hypothetical protein
MGFVPLHVPFFAVRVEPTRALPEILGGASFMGGARAGFTATVGDVTTLSDPPSLVATTDARIRIPVSAC